MDLISSIILILISAFAGAGYLYFRYYSHNSDSDSDSNKDNITNIPVNKSNSDYEKVIDNFIAEIKEDYKKQHLYNFLSLRYDIQEYSIDENYILKTKNIANVKSLTKGQNTQKAIAYLKKYNSNLYNVDSDSLSFTTDMARIEGEILALKMVKEHLNEEDYIKESKKLEEDKNTLLDTLRS